MFRTLFSVCASTLCAGAAVFNTHAIQEGCQSISAWDCGGGQYLEIPIPLQDMVAIAAGDGFTVGMRSDGQVIVWGDAPYDAFERYGGPWMPAYHIPPEIQFRTALLAAGHEYGVGVTHEGTAIRWHHDEIPFHAAINGDYSDVVALAIGGNGGGWQEGSSTNSSFIIALESAGTIFTFGNNDDGQTDVPADLGTVRAVAAGATHALALTVDGTVVGWGLDEYGQTNPPGDLEDAIAIAAGGFHSMAVRTDGSVVAWGANTEGQCDVPEDLDDVIAVSGGRAHSLALRSDGTVVGWGANDYGQVDVPQGLDDVVEVACGYYHCVARKSNGMIVAWGDNRYGQTDTQPVVELDPEDVRALATGRKHRLALRTDGTVFAWGDNEHGQTDVPSGLGEVLAIAAGGDHSIALRQDGTVIAWGSNEFGQLEIPAGLADAIAITSRYDHSMALQSDGTVVAWGKNASGQTDVPADLDDVIAIAVGSHHSLALDAGGAIIGWGSNNSSQLETPGELENAIAIGAGSAHSLAIGMDGRVFAWGSNNYHQTEVPAELEGVVKVDGGNKYSIALQADGRILAWGTPGARIPGPPWRNERYTASAPINVDRYTSIAPGPWRAMALRDLCPPCSPADFDRDDTVDQSDLDFQLALLGRACTEYDPDACLADLNHDGGVYLDDVADLLTQWGPCSCSPADFNSDGQVDNIDLHLLFEVLGQGCSIDTPDACYADLNHDGGVGLDDMAELFMYWGICD